MNKITIVFSLLSLVSFNSLSYHSDEHNNKIRQDVLNPGWDFEAKTGEKVFNKVRVKVLNNKQVQVFNEKGKRIFAIKCPESNSCLVYTTNSNNPTYEYDAGQLRLGGDKPGSIYKLSLNTIQEYKPSEYREDKYISFIIITSGGSAGSGRDRYDIHTEHGWFSKEETVFDWLRYGHPGEYPYGLDNY
ncbi:hypothetical protein [Candidatus Thioglobus autotrophicus]|jgi:hypothetical protein|uniref:hypothetical protein n=1 Tax=Candidatus Thioglobus autotrophicus TaxID=1705394 RepID=UPI00299D6D7B|nr:hypothetical protein [Candidatus Thioglobus autotrophicus]WPE18682.1 hypothetical protein R5P05_03495 [Candidatus Thioglobus autotrophicus]